MKDHPKVTVIGSINMDMTVSTPVIPKQGETVLGDHFATFPGGKGANQAVAAARLGADVRLIGAVGADAFGGELLAHLRSEQIDLSGVARIEGTSTGTATIILCNQDNRIIVAQGANAKVTPAHVEAQRSILQDSDILLVQLEIPLETIAAVASIAEEYGIPLVINPAPYQRLPEKVLERAAYLTPNEAEMADLMADIKQLPLGQKCLVTKGAGGVAVHLGNEEIQVPGYPVTPVDTTGAGDTFNGALVTRLARGCELTDAVRFANAAAALSIISEGAQSGMPGEREVYDFIDKKEAGQ